MEYRFDNLESLVNDLAEQTEKTEIVKRLQIIGKYILQNCYFEFEEGKKIFPLWIEAYYYNKNVFPDDFCHKNINRFNSIGRPYYHSDGKSVDICLNTEKIMNSDYCLSYLIKVSYDEKGTYSQTELPLPKSKDKNRIVLRKLEESNSKNVDNYFRVGLSSDHDMNKLYFQECLLSSFFDDEIEKTLTKISALKKEAFYKYYVKRHIADFKDSTDKEILEKAHIKFGYRPEKLLIDEQTRQLKTDEFPLSYDEYIESIKKGSNE